MANFYSGLSNTADALLKDKGQSITVVREVESYDPITAESVTSAIGNQTLNGAIFSKSASSYDRQLEEEKIYGETKTVILSTKDSTFTPEINDKLNIGGYQYLTYGVSKLSPAGTDVIYKLGVMLLGELEVTILTYLRPDGVSNYLRPIGGTYAQPATI